MDIIYLDFCKAFDKVPHKRLLQKLHGYGIRGKIHGWVKEFLSGREQQVIVNGSKSAWINNTSRIPPGNVFKPIQIPCQTAFGICHTSLLSVL